MGSGGGGAQIQNQRVKKNSPKPQNLGIYWKLDIGNKFKTLKKPTIFMKELAVFCPILWEPWLHIKPNYLKILKTDKRWYTWYDNRRVSVPHSKNCPTPVDMSLIFCVKTCSDFKQGILKKQKQNYRPNSLFIPHATRHQWQWDRSLNYWKKCFH